MRGGDGPHATQYRLVVNGAAGLQDAGAVASAASFPATESLSAGQHLGSSVHIDRKEYLRLIEQALMHLGFEEVSRDLEARSEVAMMDDTARQFRSAVLEERWDSAASLLSSFPSLSHHSSTHARFLLLQQKYLTLVNEQQQAAALSCLRTELAPLGVHEDRLHELAFCLVPGPAGPPPDSELAMSGTRVLSELATLIPPHMLPPEHRLEGLIEQAVGGHPNSPCHLLRSDTSAASLVVEGGAAKFAPTSEVPLSV